MRKVTITSATNGWVIRVVSYKPALDKVDSNLKEGQIVVAMKWDDLTQFLAAFSGGQL